MFDRACAVRVYAAINRHCWSGPPRLKVDVRCRVLNAQGTWDRQGWLRTYSPYVVRATAP